jgi:hypothetical protein
MKGAKKLMVQKKEKRLLKNYEIASASEKPSFAVEDNSIPSNCWKIRKREMREKDN